MTASRASWVWFAAVAAAVIALHLAWHEPTEPFFNGDETRHVMTGVFVRDALADGGYRHPRAYAERYYAQYPALGLLMWPPGFYAVEGAAMSAFGASFGTARGVMFAYWTLAAAYLFVLARRSHGIGVALLAVLLFGVSRDVFTHTRSVMLEVPLTACVLGCVFHLERYLESGRRGQLALLAFWSVAAGCHRYEAFFLPVVFAARLLFERRLGLLFKRDTIIAAVVVLLALAPVYGIAAVAVGETQARAAAHGSDPTVSAGGLTLQNVSFYPSVLGFQLGHLVAAAAVVGLLKSFRPAERAAARPYWALLLGVDLVLSLLAELESRHSIPLLPAMCVFAADALLWPWRGRRRWLTVGLVALALGEALWWTLIAAPVPSVRGYRDAVGYVRANTTGPTVVLFDGLFDGTFVYETRVADADRRSWVVRGDKLLYAVRSDPHAGYVEWAKTDADILAAIADVDPDYLVLEQPPGKYDLPMAKRLRAIVAAHPDRFEPVQEFPVTANNLDWMAGRKLAVYRNRLRNPDRPRELTVKMYWLGTEVKAARD